MLLLLNASYPSDKGCFEVVDPSPKTTLFTIFFEALRIGCQYNWCCCTLPVRPTLPSRKPQRTGRGPGSCNQYNCVFVVCVGCVICQYAGPDQCTGGFGEARTSRGFAATPALTRPAVEGASTEAPPNDSVGGALLATRFYAIWL